MPRKQENSVCSNKIDQILQRCLEYEELYSQINKLGFPTTQPDDAQIKEFVDQKDSVQLGKYLAAHFIGKGDDMLQEVNKKLIEHSFSVTDDLQCETIATSSCQLDLIGKQFDYRNLFEIVGNVCPDALNTYHHFTTEIIVKWTEKSSLPEVKHMMKIRQYVQDLVAKLDKFKSFKSKLNNIKTKATEDKLIAQFDNLVIEYNKIKLRGFDFSEAQQKKEKVSKKQQSKESDKPEAEQDDQFNENKQENEPKVVSKKNKSKTKSIKKQEQVIEKQQHNQELQDHASSEQKKAATEEEQSQKKEKRPRKQKQKKEQLISSQDEPKPKQRKVADQEQKDPKQRKLDQFFKPQNKSKSDQ